MWRPRHRIGTPWILFLSDVYLSTYFASPSLWAGLWAGLTCKLRSACFWASAKWRPNLSPFHPHICGDICCFCHLIPFNFLGKMVPQCCFGNIPAPTFHFCGINSNSSSRAGSNWFKPGRGEGDFGGGTRAGSAFGIKSKEGKTCEVLRREGWIHPGFWVIIWALDKVGPGFGIFCPCTISHDAYCC